MRVLLACGLLNALLDGLFFLNGHFTPVIAITTTLASEIVLMALIFWYIRGHLHLKLYFFDRINFRYIGLSLIFLPVTLGIRALGWGDIVTSHLSVPICMLVYFGALLLLKDETMLFLTRKMLGKLPGFRKK